MQISKAQELVLPEMKMLHQQLSVLPAVDVLKEIEREWAELKDRIEFPSKGSVAIAVGSRGGLVGSPKKVSARRSGLPWK
ncbi:MAG: hypothetical protein NTY44_11570 [Deltaproteobacteria bacterium]|nr:hypothetical protein [Deltaproteobacteria bacterium]